VASGWHQPALSLASPHSSPSIPSVVPLLGASTTRGRALCRSGRRPGTPPTTSPAAPQRKGSAHATAGARVQRGPFPVPERRCRRRAASQGDSTDRTFSQRPGLPQKTQPAVNASFFSETPSFISIAQKARVPPRRPNQRPFQRQSRVENCSLFSRQLTAQEPVAPHRTSVRLRPLHRAEAMSVLRRPAIVSSSLAERAERDYTPRFSAT